MMVSLRIAVLVASLALAVDSASQGPVQNVKEMNCSDEAHCQVIVTITCHHVMFCNASVDVEGVNARGNNVFWKIADDETSQKFAFDQRRGIEFKTEAGRKAFDCMPVGQRFKCRNLPDAPPAKYFYSVMITGVPRLDPWVVNH